MTDVIIDTNVVVVANRQNPDVRENCIDACRKFLSTAHSDCVVLIDNDDEIKKEYLAGIDLKKSHELGARFVFHLLQNQYNEKHFRRIKLFKDDGNNYIVFPGIPALINFDQSDRKFAALALKEQTPVTNATDSDWAHFRAPLADNGIEVNFLCGCEPNNWFVQNP